ncbi:chaperone protein dnaJ 20, chloroplastic-like [Salvia miltiorrhiza]|uniref:chaperone protein dnaJ 20, chloroplastic-like n=1 Tax=Salvia miltiorrhiza TaxID=226208 RepID=UPI0025AD2301|nr:chaperone protein dnaJ 20, chloroplastic-like [Salvia miltiorrhiza]
MGSKIIISNPTLQIHSNANQFPKTHFPQNISNMSQLSKSRIPTRNSSGAPRAHSAAQISALYAPAQTKETLYELLGIAENVSSFSDIKKAYKHMARKYHPDVSPPDRVDEYTRRFIMVHEAYETLSNPQTKALYDRDLAVGAAFPNSWRKHQGMEWRSSWQSQLDELQRRDCRERH